jgi:cytochrome P450
MATPSIFEQIVEYANRADPWPLYRELRQTPVLRQPDGSYLVSRYQDIVTLLHDPRASSSGPGAPGIVRRDPPEHDRMRQILMRHFGPPETPGRIEGMRTDITEITTALIDRLGARKQADLVDDFAYPLPVTVICRLLGVPLEDEPRFRAWADSLIERPGPVGTAADQARRQREADDIFAQLTRYLGTLADAHRQAPGEDLISALVTDDRTWDGMSRAELLANAATLLLAGHLTTVNLIASGMLTLLRQPAMLDRLRAEPSFAVHVVEELLRYEPPVHFLSRLALDDIGIAGVTIPAGAQIRLVIAAGNRDPDHVRDPDRFDPDRHDPERAGEHQSRHGQHLGFGGGIHYCFGAPLARLEGQIALAELARRLDNPQLLADPPPYRLSAFLRGPRHLPVGYDGIRPAGQPGTPGTSSRPDTTKAAAGQPR